MAPQLPGVLAAYADHSFGDLVVAFAISATIVVIVSIWSERSKRRQQRDAAMRRGGLPSTPPPPMPPRVNPLQQAGGTTPTAAELQARVLAAAAAAAASPYRQPAAPPAPAAPPPAPKKLNLDAGAFQPISGAQATREAGAFSSWGSALWQFGRRDLIPPAEDPRTSIIDRAMVGHGLITPEELVEIHTIGRQMDEVRPDVAQAHQAADRAVSEDKEARAKLKQQKKAEAAERKQLHAEAVKKRKATDIIFLGRGVSKGLADRRSHIEKLQAAGLPVLSTPADVAAALGLTIPRLRWLAFHADASPVSHYARFTVKKRSGGERLLSAPMAELAKTQEWILANVLSKLPTHEAAHGFVPGRSTVSNATPHVDKDVVVNTDLKDFFPSITFRRVAGLFRELGYSPAVAVIFGLLCTDAPRRKVVYATKPFWVAAGPRALPQGACTSPAISNLVARRMDSRLNGIARKLGWRYTRYADDLTFSMDRATAASTVGATPASRSSPIARDETATQGHLPLRGNPPLQEAAESGGGRGGGDGIGYLLARVRHISDDEGFAVNETKTRVLRQSTRQLVTGVVVNDRPGVQRETVRRLRAILHKAKTEGLAAQNRQRIPHFEAWVDGMIAYIHMVNPKQAEPLRAAFEAVAAK